VVRGVRSGVVSLSPRLAAIVDALPLRPASRVLEIGCGPGAAARVVAERVSYVLAIDRSAKAIAQARAIPSAAEFRQVAIEDFVLEPGVAPFDLVFAVRVGALDGRHPGEAAMRRIAEATTADARLFVDGQEVVIPHQKSV
jgi:protein-L-isoaspartate O-methyltransferase